jgi:hypothetical protein
MVSPAGTAGGTGDNSIVSPVWRSVRKTERRSPNWPPKTIHRPSEVIDGSPASTTSTDTTETDASTRADVEMGVAVVGAAISATAITATIATRTATFVAAHFGVVVGRRMLSFAPLPGVRFVQLGPVVSGANRF